MKKSLIVFAILGVVFFLTDCSIGTTRFLECYVFDREYHAAWTQIITTTDSEGQLSFHTIHHPEEYRLWCSKLDEPCAIGVLVTSGQYNSITNGQQVTVKTRQGRWTRIYYLRHIN